MKLTLISEKHEILELTKSLRRKKYLEKKDARLNRLKDKSETQFTCKTCSKFFSDQRLLSDHNNTIHLGKKQLSCKHCNFTTFSSTSLKRHMEITRKTCDRCSMLVCIPLKHITDCVNKPDKKEKLPCPICRQKYGKNFLKTHIRNVHEKAKKCENCDAVLEYREMHK